MRLVKVRMIPDEKIHSPGQGHARHLDRTLTVLSRLSMLTWQKRMTISGIGMCVDKDGLPQTLEASRNFAISLCRPADKDDSTTAMTLE